MSFRSRRTALLRTCCGKVWTQNGPHKNREVNKLKFPSNKKEVCQFLGLAGYFRDFMRDFAGISAPLTNVTKDKIWKLLNCLLRKKISVSTLKNKINEDPILPFPDFNLSFTLEIDASNSRIAAVLLQQKLDLPVLISCASRLYLLSPAEKNYSTGVAPERSWPL